MPIHGYLCQNQNCKKEYEYFHVGSNDKNPVCPFCSQVGTEADRQVPTNTSHNFKGGNGGHNDQYNKRGRKR